MFTYDGETQIDAESQERADRQISNGEFGGALALGVTAAAGAAAERKLCIEKEYPVDTRVTAKWDREKIDSIANRLTLAGEGKIAFQELVWGRAQGIVENRIVWLAISSVAFALSRSPWEEYDGGVARVILGAVAMEIMERAGVSPIVEAA